LPAVRLHESEDEQTLCSLERSDFMTLSRKSDPYCMPRERNKWIEYDISKHWNRWNFTPTAFCRSELRDYIQRALRSGHKLSIVNCKIVCTVEMRNVNFIIEGKILIYEKFFFNVKFSLWWTQCYSLLYTTISIMTCTFPWCFNERSHVGRYRINRTSISTTAI